MVHVEKTRIKGKIYYKLVHSIRVNGKVKSKTKYLGKDLPGEEQLEKLKKDFYREVIEKRSLEKQSIPVAAPNVNLKEKKDYLFEKSPIAIIEMDWSELKIHLDNLNVANLEDYLAERPQRIQALLNEIQVKKANDCALNLFGVVSNKFFKNFSDFVPAHSLTSFIQIFSKIFQGAVKISHDIVIKNSRDNEIDLKMDVSILKTDWSSVSIVFQDISELKLNLEKSDIAFKALNSSNNAIIISDRVGIITYANKSFIEMFNYSSKYYVIGRTLLSILSSHSKSEKFINFLEQDKNVVEELVFQRIDGKSITVEASLSQIQDRNQLIVGKVVIFVDVTKQTGSKEYLKTEKEKFEKLVEEKTSELKTTESKFRNLIETLPEIVYTADLKTLSPTMINQQIETVLGYTQDEWLSDPSLWRKSIYFEDRDNYINQLTDAKLQQIPLDITFRMWTKSGGLIWIRNVISWGRDSKGNINCINGLMIDNSQFQEANRKFLDLFSYSPVAMQELDYSAIRQYVKALNLKNDKDVVNHFVQYPEAIIQCIKMVKLIDFNNENLKLYQFDSRKEFRENFHEKKFYRPDFKIFLKEICAIAKGKHKLETSIDIFSSDGKRKKVTWKWIIPKVHQLKYGKVLASIVDTSMQRKLSESMRVKNSAIESSSSGIVITDLDGTITYANNSFENFINPEYSKIIIGSKINDFLPHEKGPLYILHQVHLKSKWDGVLIFKRDEEKLYLDVNAIIVKDNYQEPTGIVFSYIDITEHMNTEKIRLEFTNIAAHELKTPIVPLKTFISMMNDKPEDYGINDKGKKFLEICLRNLTRLNYLIGDILDISRLEAGGMKFKASKFDLAKLIRLRIEDFQIDIIKKGLKLRPSIEKIPLIYGDKQRIGEVLGNLLKNAINFTEVGTISVAAKNKEKFIEVSVTDTGIGIRQSAKEKLFSKFFQAHDITTRKTKGSGLGLAICKGIIEAHGGEIYAKSEGIGTGTTITFTLPLKSNLITTGPKKEENKLVGDEMLIKKNPVKKIKSKTQSPQGAGYVCKTATTPGSD